MCQYPPDVTVVIPVFNRADFLVRAVRSCLDQTCRVEVIVVDDGSAQDIRGALEQQFPEHILSTRFPRLHYLRQDNQGACVARNAGMAHAAAPFIKFLDSDDLLVPGALDDEYRTAREAGCDVLITSWEERTLHPDGSEDVSKRRLRQVPDLSRGIDDMLAGRSVCVSAALYRTAFIRALRWDPTWTKAQDWAWLLTVCLAGARFHSLNIPSCVYQHHSGERITNYGDLTLRSTRGRQEILAMVERELRAQGGLTESRRLQLAQYYYRDCQVLAEHDPAEWTRIWEHVQSLAPGFTPREPNRIIRALRRVLGTYRGVRAYVALKRFYFSIVRRGVPIQVRSSAT